jgi:hypothetical protein
LAGILLSSFGLALYYFLVEPVQYYNEPVQTSGDKVEPAQSSRDEPKVEHSWLDWFYEKCIDKFKQAIFRQMFKQVLKAFIKYRFKK